MPKIPSFLKKQSTYAHITLGVVSVIGFYMIPAYFSDVAVKNTKQYYKEGKSMQVSIPEELKEEYFNKVKRKYQARRSEENDLGSDSIDLIN